MFHYSSVQNSKKKIQPTDKKQISKTNRKQKTRVKWNHEKKKIVPLKKPPRGGKELYMNFFEFFTKPNHVMVPTPLTSRFDHAIG